MGKKDFFYNKANGDPKEIFGESITSDNITLSRNTDRVDDVYLEGSSSDSVRSIPEKQLGLHIRNTRWKSVLLIIFLTMLIITSKAWWLQITHGSTYRVLAEENRIQLLTIHPTRGHIFDRNGVVLADNVPLYQLTLQRETWGNLPKKNKEAIKSSLFKQNIFIDDVLVKNDSSQELVLKELSYSEALSLITMTQTMKGIDVKITSRRLYKDPLIYSHLLGFVSSLTPEQYDVLYDTYLINDVIGKTGLEKEYEDTLRGLLGKKSVEVNAFGKEANIISIKEPKNGDDIYLTIDSKIQEKLYEYVQKHIDRLNKGRGAAVVLDPSTGEILALVSYPGYNNQTFYQGINTTEYRELLNDVNKPLFNRAVDGQYPPGSTFKLVVATAGLEDKIITPTTNIYSSGGIKVSRWFFPDWKFGGHGYTNLYKAISESVNTYFYILGGGFEERVGLGVSRINEQARKFGLGGKTGVDFPNESPGFLPTPDWKKEQKNERWYIGDTYNLSIGQGDLLVTPLQMANVIATVSNGGTLYEPHFLKSKYKNNNSVDQSSWVIDNQVISKKIMEEIRKATRETVLTGSGIRLLSAPITSAGKTGTAEWSNKKDPHGWYIGFAPYQDPEIAFAFIVEEGIGGNTSAVPIADDFLNWYGSEYKTNDDL